ncbi:hypothetical protein MU852_07945 [Brevundimonas albigilva]|uniref:Uncharacterized protein n=1 Tax=Brevundimonas albigilva TaxID=1312364 RepID=A0ABY4SN99_9CAUL|nr:hypothetical protein [Brevundimonas albigilva]UQV19652.1 hypothetical protein MU852_07945 [Brevundimonas albigilva]URI15321.1 hypothetical protein M8231_16275 [Brevundimonas albigilva]
MADDPRIINLAAVRTARTAPPTHTFSSEEEAAAAVRAALDTLAAACTTINLFTPFTTVDDWAGLISDGFRNRMASRIGGAA